MDEREITSPDAGWVDPGADAAIEEDLESELVSSEREMGGGYDAVGAALTRLQPEDTDPIS